MQNYKFVLEYDGTRYSGWQKLKDDDNTIQGKLEQVLSRMTGSDVQVIGAGRTDAGVHARGQAANAVLETEKTAEEIKQYINHYLPEDIRVISAEKADPRFHSRYHAAEKEYCYTIFTGEKPSVFERRYLYRLGQTLDIERMRLAADQLIGTHD
ncbi:MAG: tRNA pseudouridine(38-40) synthase TruA, partial [Eubacteriales bacterium]|nr:tRNA pseudouridine(38-40) synthase TruA [Eubacteriales bacterium]